MKLYLPRFNVYCNPDLAPFTNHVSLCHHNNLSLQALDCLDTIHSKIIMFVVFIESIYYQMQFLYISLYSLIISIDLKASFVTIFRLFYRPRIGENYPL